MFGIKKVIDFLNDLFYDWCNVYQNIKMYNTKTLPDNYVSVKVEFLHVLEKKSNMSKYDTP